MTYPEAQDYLLSLKHSKAKYGIDRMTILSDRLGHPERNYPVIHIAGTNGKGSTAAMIEAICRKAGLKTGMFTSPHLIYLGERIQVNREILSQDQICRYIPTLKEHAEAMAANCPDDHPSFFEFMTGMAFTHFSKEAVDIAIIETGLGGELDSTNVVEPNLCIITSIGLDHTEQLGNSYESVASAKAGIIKKNIPVIMGCINDEAAAVITKKADELSSPIKTVKECFGADISNYPETNLKGDFQRINAAIATIAAKSLPNLIKINDKDISEALMQIDWAGRWQEFSIQDNKRLILDSTHNPEGAEELDKLLRSVYTSNDNKPIIISGTLGMDRARALIPTISEHAAEIVLVEPDQDRACTAEQLKSLIPDSFKGDVKLSSIKELFPEPMQCKVGNFGETIVATGSIYMIGEIMGHLQEFESKQESMLQD